MSVRRRLAALEESGSPGAAVALWLAEAHEYPTIADYVRSRIQAGTEHPLAAVERRVTAGEVRRVRRDGHLKEPRDRDPVREAIARYHLALVLEHAASEYVARNLYRAAFLRLVLSQRVPPPGHGAFESADLDPPGAARTDDRASWARAAAELIAEVELEAHARRQLERDLLCRASAMFPDTAAMWDDLQTIVEDLEVLIDPHRDAEPPPAAPEESNEHRSGPLSLVKARVSALLDEARASAFDSLGEHDEAEALIHRLLAADDPDA